MGSLVSGWDSSRHGKPPKGFEDYQEPYTPRSGGSRPHKDDSEMPASPRLARVISGPPNLSRSSAPPKYHCMTPRSLSLARGGTGTPVSPRMSSIPGSPRSPAGSPPSPFARQTSLGGPAADAFSRFLSLSEEEKVDAKEVLKKKEVWCTRVDSAGLNIKPDEVDVDAWRHGQFKLDDEMHITHFKLCPPCPPGTVPVPAAAAPQAPQAPETPPTSPTVPSSNGGSVRDGSSAAAAADSPVQRPGVSPERTGASVSALAAVGGEGMESLDSAGL